MCIHGTIFIYIEQHVVLVVRVGNKKYNVRYDVYQLNQQESVDERKWNECKNITDKTSGL